MEHVSCSDLQHVLQTLGEKLSADETQATQKKIKKLELVITYSNVSGTLIGE